MAYKYQSLAFMLEQINGLYGQLIFKSIFYHKHMFYNEILFVGQALFNNLFFFIFFPLNLKLNKK